MIVLVFGLPGSGKSFFASRLAEKLEAKYMSSDRVRRGVLPTSSYSEEEKMQVYEDMMAEMEITVRKGENIVLDATFYKRLLRERFVKKAKSLGETAHFIEVCASEALIQERLAHQRQESDANYEVYLKIKRAFDPLLADHLRLQSTSDNIDWMLQEALAYLQGKNES